MFAENNQNLYTALKRGFLCNYNHLMMSRGLVLFSLVCVPMSALADRTAQFEVLDKRNSPGFALSLEVAPVYIPPLPGSEPENPARKNQWFETAARIAAKYNIPQTIFIRLIDQESGWNPSARSNKGAIGLTQLMPETASFLGVDPFDPHENIEGGARYLAQQYQTFRNWKLALAAYNAGPNAVRQYRGVPPFKETENYVKSILR